MGTDFRDVDNDGQPDLFVTAISNETFSYFHNEGHGIFDDFTHPSLLARWSLFLSGWSNGIYDMNNDGWKDLVAVNSHVNDKIEMEQMNVPFRQPNAVFLNDKGRFMDAQPNAGQDFVRPLAHRGCAFGDLNNDGRIDLAVSALGCAGANTPKYLRQGKSLASGGNRRDAQYCGEFSGSSSPGFSSHRPMVSFSCVVSGPERAFRELA